MAGAPTGNRNAGKSKPWTDAIRRAIARKDAENGDGYTLNTLANQLIENCLNQENVALVELTQRLDGKAVQGVELDADIRMDAVNTVTLVAGVRSQG